MLNKWYMSGPLYPKLPMCLGVPCDLPPFATTSDSSPAHSASPLLQHSPHLHNWAINAIPDQFPTSSLSLHGSLSESPYWHQPLILFRMSPPPVRFLGLVPCSAPPKASFVPFSFGPIHDLITWSTSPWVCSHSRSVFSKDCSFSCTVPMVRNTTPLSSLLCSLACTLSAFHGSCLSLVCSSVVNCI